MTPPKLATWLLQHGTLGPKRESLMGDLIEQYEAGRSSLWYWRQVVMAVLGGVGAEAWDQKGLIAAVLITSGYLLNWLYMAVLWPLVVLPVDRAWYPPFMSWLLARDLDTIRLIAYRVRLWDLTGNTASVMLLIVAVRCFVWVRPAQRKLIAGLFVITQVAERLPYVRVSFLSWVAYRHHDPSWFFAFFDFALLTFVVWPFTVWMGAFYNGKGKCLVALD